MNSNRRSLLIALLVGAMLAVAGCTSAISGDDDPDVDVDISDEELLTNIEEATEEVETAATSMEISASADGEEMMDMSADGVIDFESEKMKLETEMDMLGQSMEIDQYIIGDTMYQQLEGQWYQEEYDESWEQDEYAQYEEALEDATDLEIVDETTTNGHEVYVVDADIDEDAMSDIMEDEAVEDGIDMSMMEINDIEMEQHVNTDTYHIHHVNMNMEVSMLGEEMSMSMAVDYDEINEPVDIELPEEAEDAQPMGAGF